VLHLDANEYYGSRHASLTLDELVEWSQSHGATCSPSTLPDSLKELSRRYAISLFPALLPSVGPLIDKLIQSDVGKYVTFRILSGVFVANSAAASTEVDGRVEFKAVPASKEAVFKDKTISLLDKRKLMKFLLMAVGNYESSESLKGASWKRIVTCVMHRQTA
jgi:RAB protein geranylgeranyltransferase component A